LSTSSILTRLNDGAPYVLGGAPRTSSEWVSSIKGMLQSSWGVTDGASLRETLGWLRESGHGAEFDKLQTLCNQSLQQYGPGFAFEQYYPEEASKLRFVQQHQAAIGPRSLLAWDAGRLVAVAGWGYLAGYIDEREAWG